MTLLACDNNRNRSNKHESGNDKSPTQTDTFRSTMPKQDTTMVGFRNEAFQRYKFNSQCTRFIKMVEQYFTKINIEEKQLPLSNYGDSQAIGDSAKIIINQDDRDKEELIIHELYHLYLRVLGFPKIEYSFSNPNTQTKENITYLNWFNHLFWDKIHHHYYYPIMFKELGLNPYNTLTLELNEVLKNQEITGLSQQTKHVALAGYYLQTWIETQDENLVLKLGELLQKKYEGAGITLGQMLISKFKTAKLQTKDDALTLFIECFNLIHKSEQIRIGAPRITEIQKKFYTQRIATFEIIPAGSN